MTTEISDALHKADPKRAADSNAASSASASSAASAAAARLKGIDAFCFDYRVQWPVSLVLSRTTLTKYQLVFRHLLRVKQVERTLQDSWVTLQVWGGMR